MAQGCMFVMQSLPPRQRISVKLQFIVLRAKFDEFIYTHPPEILTLDFVRTPKERKDTFISKLVGVRMEAHYEMTH